MKCQGDDAITRMARLGAHLASGGAVDTQYIMQTFGVSRSTAKRDLVRLESVLPVDVQVGVRTML